MKVYETNIRYGKILSTPKSKHIWLLGYNKVTIKNVENTKQQIFMLWRESLFFDQKWMKFNAIFFCYQQLELLQKQNKQFVKN